MTHTHLWPTNNGDFDWCSGQPVNVKIASSVQFPSPFCTTKFHVHIHRYKWCG